jgi:uncharacterized membrane protein
MNTTSTAAFTFDEVLKSSIELTKKNWVKYLKLIGATILVYIAYGIVYGIISGLLGLPGIIDSILSFFLGVYVSLFMARGALAVVRSENFDIQSWLKLDGKTYLAAVLASILFYLAVGLGLALLIVPGIIAAITLCFYTYSLVDKQTEAVQSLEDSMNMTKGNRWTIFFYNLALGAIGAVTIAVPAVILFVVAVGAGSDLGMPVIVAVSIVFVALMAAVAMALSMVSMSGNAYMYTKMRAKTPLVSKK